MALELGPNWAASPFGSVGNGFNTHFSDLDVTCYQTAPTTLSPKDALVQLHPIVLRHGCFEVVEIISTARIPVLKAWYGKRLEVDISFQNAEALRNTRLLKEYSLLCPSVRELVILIKSWAKAEGVCGAVDGHLSSYAFTLMVIYFLQVDPMLRLPCFPTSPFTGDIDAPPPPTTKWKCPISLDQLAGRFFLFYTTAFAWGYEVVLPRIGKRLYANDRAYCQLQGIENVAMIHIEDPFLLGRNLNCVLRESMQEGLWQKLCLAQSSVQVSRPPAAFIAALKRCQWKAIGAAPSEDSSVPAN